MGLVKNISSSYQLNGERNIAHDLFAIIVLTKLLGE
jgi:hypothetical protein